MDKNTPALVVEDMDTISQSIVRDLKQILSWGIHACSNYEDAIAKISELKENWATKLLLVLDWSFPEKEWKEHTKPLANNVISFVAEQFWPDFLLHLIPFSANTESNEEMARISKEKLSKTVIIKLGSKLDSDKIWPLIEEKIKGA